jgi:hypothetical protein
MEVFHDEVVQPDGKQESSSQIRSISAESLLCPKAWQDFYRRNF